MPTQSTRSIPNHENPSIKDIQKKSETSTPAAQLRLGALVCQPSDPDADKRRFLFAARDTTCGSMARKAVFTAYAQVATETGATWDTIGPRGKRVRYFARATRIAKIAECGRSTVRRETARLVADGRLIRLQASGGRLPAVYQVVPEGWGAAHRPETEESQRRPKQPVGGSHRAHAESLGGSQWTPRQPVGGSQWTPSRDSREPALKAGGLLEPGARVIPTAKPGSAHGSPPPEAVDPHPPRDINRLKRWIAEIKQQNHARPHTTPHTADTRATKTHPG